MNHSDTKGKCGNREKRELYLQNNTTTKHRMIENHYFATTVTKMETIIQNNSFGFFQDYNFIKNGLLLPVIQS